MKQFYDMIESFNKNRSNIAVIMNGNMFTFGDLYDSIKYYSGMLNDWGIRCGDVVVLDNIFTFDKVALFLSLLKNANIVCVVPVAKSSNGIFKELFANYYLSPDGIEGYYNYGITHELYENLRLEKRPGLVLLTSGTSGAHKIVVHDFYRLFSKYKIGKDLVTLLFLDFDHIGGLDTLLYALYNSSTVVVPHSRSVFDVCKAVSEFGVEVLPVSPSFLNILLVSGAYKEYDLSTLKYITYGAEPISDSLLKHLTETFPDVKIIQKYGMTEVGTLRTKTLLNSPFIIIDGDSCKTRVVDGKLEIKTDTSMLGYLNAPSPFTEDGWLKTNDVVEVIGGAYRILGRASEVIHVGGNKVYPSRVAGVINDMPNVECSLVYAMKSDILGFVPAVKVKLIKPESVKEFTKRMLEFCSDKLERYEIPYKVEICEDLEFDSHGKLKQVKYAK